MRTHGKYINRGQRMFVCAEISRTYNAAQRMAGTRRRLRMRARVAMETIEQSCDNKSEQVEIQQMAGSFVLRCPLAGPHLSKLVTGRLCARCAFMRGREFRAWAAPFVRASRGAECARASRSTCAARPASTTTLQSDCALRGNPSGSPDSAATAIHTARVRSLSPSRKWFPIGLSKCKIPSYIHSNEMERECKF